MDDDDKERRVLAKDAIGTRGPTELEELLSWSSGNTPTSQLEHQRIDGNSVIQNSMLLATRVNAVRMGELCKALVKMDRAVMERIQEADIEALMAYRTALEADVERTSKRIFQPTDPRYDSEILAPSAVASAINYRPVQRDEAETGTPTAPTVSPSSRKKVLDWLKKVDAQALEGNPSHLRVAEEDK